MKLDINCIRDILLLVEEHSNLNENYVTIPINVFELIKSNHLSSYTDKEIVYTVKKLDEAYYIDAVFKYADNSLYTCYIYELTYEGHQLLDTIRNNKVIESINKKLDNLGSSVTIEIIKLLATNILKEKLGLKN
mgnify:CR=1 FL=1